MASKSALNSFHRQIGLDHFYVGFSHLEIQDLKVLAKLPFCSFSEVKSGKDSWRGVYWTTTQGHYFEMIERAAPDNYTMGIAFSANAIQYFDVRSIAKLFPKIKFLKTIRRLGKLRWFDGLYSRPHEGRSIFIWLMHYYFCPRDRKPKGKDLPSFVQRFTELEVRVPENFAKDLQEAGFWSPIRTSGSAKRLILEMRQKDRSEFKIYALVDTNLEFCEFVSLRGEASPFCRELPKLKMFDLKRVGQEIVLKRKSK